MEAGDYEAPAQMEADYYEARAHIWRFFFLCVSWLVGGWLEEKKIIVVAKPRRFFFWAEAKVV